MNVREYVLNTLFRIVYEGAYASLSMRSEIMDSFTSADKALASELVYGTLRNYVYLEYQWKDLIEKKPKNKISVLLNMSVYQLLFLERIPSYAVVDEAVKLCGKSEKGFVNAVLRQVIRRGRRPIENVTEIERISLETSHPLWILNMWNKHYGKTKMEQIARFDQTRSKVYGRINSLKVVKEQMERNKDVMFINDISFLYNGNLTETKWFQNGQILIQDISSSQIPLKMKLESGMRVLDLCSAPGTKAQEIAMLMENKGEIIACDYYSERVKLIDTLMMLTGVDIVSTKVIDARVFNTEFKDSPFDRILIDAPCSGLGDLRHKPEIRLHLQPENIDELLETQRLILEQSVQYLKSGGYLVYSTCTLNRKENELQIQKFLKNHSEFTLEEECTYFPDECQSDGFYFARLKKETFMVE